MKKIICILCVMSMVFQIGFAFALDEYTVEVSVKVNDQYLKAETSHVLKIDTVFVVAKSLVEGVGGTIEWIEATQQVIIRHNESIIKLTIGSDKAEVNGELVDLYKAPYLENGRTMIPVGFVAKTLGFQVNWVEATYTVELLKADVELEDAYVLDRNYTDEDLYTLAKIVTVESGDQSFDMALAIANTVYNRVKSDRFPNTVADVIYQVDVYKQFPPAHKSSFQTLEPSFLATLVAKRTLEGVNNIGDALFFNNQPFKSKSDDLIKVIDGEYFYN